MASVFEKPNFALSSERSLCACVALFCIKAKLNFPTRTCSAEFRKIIPSVKVFRRIAKNYRHQFIANVPSVEEVPTKTYISKGFESAIQRNAFMAEMREQEYTPGSYTIGKMYYEYLDCLIIDKTTTVEGFAASEMLLASAILGEHNLEMGKKNRERHRKAASHIRGLASAAVITDNSHRLLVDMFRNVSDSAEEILTDSTSAFAEMVRRLCISSHTRTQQHLYNLYRNETDREPLDLSMQAHELHLAPLFGIKHSKELRVFKIRDIFIIRDYLNKKSYVLTMNHLDHLRSVTAWTARLWFFWKNYRTLGKFETDQGDVYQVNEHLLRMIALRIKEREGDPLLAREIKAVQFILFSDFHEEVNEVDTGAAERVDSLEKEFAETYNPSAESNFLAFMKGANITLRAKIDVLNVFAILPPPDY